MENSPKDEREHQEGRPVVRRGGPNFLVIIIILTLIALIIYAVRDSDVSTISYDFFQQQLDGDNVASIELGETEARGVFTEAPEAPVTYDANGKPIKPAREKLFKKFRVTLPPKELRGDLQAQLDEKQVRRVFKTDDGTQNFLLLMAILLPIGLFIFFWLNYRRTRDQIMGGGFLSGFSKSPAKRYEGLHQAITFDDVAGLEGVKADLMEIVDYLKSPQKFQKLGGRVPKGVLLNGPPGTGKTLLARAVAGEAGVPFYSVNGSEFIQMFVGVGASRVRDLFRTAKENGPAIIFIDEIDAVGRQRGAGLGGGHDEREQTLNQILSEMDGFTPTDSVIVLAATNRSDVLDPALLRPGRFDRHVTVNRPTKKGRLEIFKVHVRDVPLGEDVDLDRLAANTVGLTGADLRNIVNEAALWAARRDKSRVEMEDFEYARDKVLMGARREEVLSDDEKEKTAYHEAGHTLAAWKLRGANRVHKVTIIPRGFALGTTQMMPSEDRLSLTRHELADQLIVLLGGRAAELLIYDESTVGAENDLQRATGIARRMVAHWGMSDRLGPVSYKMHEDDPFLGREIHQQRQFSEHTMEVIDEEVARILHDAAEQSMNLLRENRENLEAVTRALIDNEELSEAEITELIGPSVHVSESESAAPESPSLSESSSGSSSPSST